MLAPSDDRSLISLLPNYNILYERKIIELAYITNSAIPFPLSSISLSQLSIFPLLMEFILSVEAISLAVIINIGCLSSTTSEYAYLST